MPGSPRPWAAASWTLTLALMLTAPGCGMLSRARLADCTQRVQALQAETSQLKDEALGLRAENRELVQRAIDDAGRLRALTEANQNLERSVVAYQEERDDLAEAYEDLQRLVRSSSGLTPAADVRPLQSDTRPLPSERLASFAAAHPGCQYDPQRGVWSFPTALLFQPGSTELAPGSALLLGAFGRILAGSDSAARPTRIVGHAAASPVQQASVEVPSDAAVEELGRARAARVRDLLAEGLDLDAASIDLRVEAPALDPDPASDAPEHAGTVEIHLAPVRTD